MDFFNACVAWECTHLCTDFHCQCDHDSEMVICIKVTNNTKLGTLVNSCMKFMSVQVR